MSEDYSSSLFEYQWCLDEFADVELKDARLNRRCGELAAQLATQPGGSINRACEDWADTKAAYRFFDNKKVTPEELLKPHQQRTVKRMTEHSIVLAVQDTSFINFTHHPQTEGLGAIGNKAQQQRGFGMHSTLAVTPQGLSLGLLTQDFFERTEDGPSHEPQDCRKLPIEEKESYRWVQAFKQTLKLAPPGVDVITVCDREADIYEMFVLAKDKEAGLLVRASTDRVLVDEHWDKLWSKVENQPVVDILTVHVPKKDKQEKRTATVVVRFTTVTLKPPWRPERKKLPAITLNAVLVREENPPPKVKPIEWLLLTNTPVASVKDADQAIKWYCGRWQIETFHKILKSGCTVEDCRLQNAERLQNYIAMMSVIAWRLHWMTYINRCEPHQPCTVVLTTIEWQALFMRIHKSARLPDTVPSVRQAVRWIAQLGGFLGRKSDGEPGVTTIWRGWQRLQDIAATWYLVNDQTQLVGNS